MNDRFDAFTDRVSAERVTLSAINQLPNLQVPLSGLTDAAVAAWLMANPLIDRRGRLVSMLRELSRRLAIDADRSKQVFDSNPVPSSVMELVNCIRYELNML
jgi:hypothetical protein